MKKQLLPLALIVVFISTALAAESSAQTLDQRSVTSENVSGWAISDRNAQTVTVGVEGYLSRIDLQFFQSDEIASGDVVVDIFELDTSGAPDVSNLIGSATIANGAIPTSTQLRERFRYTPADFSSQNLFFNVGDQFAIVPRRTDLSNTGRPPWILWTSGNGSSYDDGTFFLDGFEGWSPRDGAMGFQTFVTAEPADPEPEAEPEPEPEPNATANLFFDLRPYDGSEELIDFDSSGVRPFDRVNRIASVRFNLVNEGTLTDSGISPTGASAPNTTYGREFAPFDGSVFINFQFGVDLELRFDNLINTASAEIRARPFSSFPQGSVTFELYNGANLVSTLTTEHRGIGDFFSYGVQSTELFDRLVIRNREDQRFSLENLRFARITTATLGDCNHDGSVNFLDITPFLSFIFVGYQTEADINEDGITDFLDISPFIELLTP